MTCVHLSLKKRQREFEDYIKDKYITAKADFRTLLKETKFITYRSERSSGLLYASDGFVALNLSVHLS